MKPGVSLRYDFCLSYVFGSISQISTELDFIFGFVLKGLHLRCIVLRLVQIFYVPWFSPISLNSRGN